MNPEAVVGFTLIIMLLAWAIGFLSGALWLWGKVEREKERERQRRELAVFDRDLGD